MATSSIPECDNRVTLFQKPASRQIDQKSSNFPRRLKLFTALAMLASSCLLGGCAMSTRYQPGQGSYTGGYHDTKIDTDIYSVDFSGNGFTSANRVTHFWLYRCAEITLQNGADYFVILGNVNAIQAPENNPNSIIRWRTRASIRIERGTVPANNRRSFDARTVMAELGDEVRTGQEHTPPYTRYAASTIFSRETDAAPDGQGLSRRTTLNDLRDLVPPAKP